MRRSSWFNAVSPPHDRLFQGDVIIKCKVFTYDPNKKEVEQQTLSHTVVLNQTCDLHHRGLKNILLTPAWQVHEFFPKHPDKRIRQTFDMEIQTEDDFINWLKNTSKSKRNTVVAKLEEIRKRRIHHLCLLGPSEHWRMLIVDFRNLFVVPRDIVLEDANNNGLFRLKPPYREYLSHSFGHYFTRIALPDEGGNVEAWLRV